MNDAITNTEIRHKESLPYLIYCNIVAWLLKARGVVIPVPHNDPHLVKYDSADQLVGALHLNHDGGDVVGGLREREKTDMSFKYYSG